tara:strand:- start:308 stop:556 length:249 start_codon:yes stop_codon:yes gene_type:complete
MAMPMIFALCSATPSQKYTRDQKQPMPTGASSTAFNFSIKQFRSSGSRRSMALIVLNALMLIVLIFIAVMVYAIGERIAEKK